MGQRVSLCMIARDEELSLPRCLQSVQGVVDEIVLVDTGSTDRTIAIAEQYGAVVRQIPWEQDFAAARNASLDLATGDWVLLLDADEALLPESRALLPALISDETVEGYYIQMHNLVGSETDPEIEVSVLFRLWRNRPGYRFHGSVHEQILSSIHRQNPHARIVSSPLKAIHYGYLTEHVASKGKRDRNASLLEARLREHPDEPFLLFNIGIEHYLQRRFAEARQAFGWSLERTGPEAPWRAKLVKCHAAALCELEEWEEAFALLQEETGRYPDYTDLFYIQGVAHNTLGQYREAVETFSRCLALGPAPCPPYTSVNPETGASKAYLGLGIAYEGLGQYGEAYQAYARSAMAKRGWAEPLKRIASLMGRRVDDATLIRVLEAFFPGGTTADQVKIASLLIHAGRYPLALERLEPLLPDGLDRGGRYALAVCLAKVGRVQEALAICEEDWEGSPLQPQVRALALELRGQL